MQDQRGASSGGSARRPTYDELVAENERLRQRLGQVEPRVAELERLLEEVRRAAKRQSAPFSKNKPKDERQTPGRKKGKAHGRHGHRAVPPDADRILDAPLPECCPHCGQGVDFERWAEQFQTELPEVQPVTTRFRVGVGRCRSCKRRVQGRHPEQVSDALGAAASQVGPRAMAWAAWLHYGLGLSFGKTSALWSAQRRTSPSEGDCATRGGPRRSVFAGRRAPVVGAESEGVHRAGPDRPSTAR